MGDVSGAVADLGILVPLVAALVLVNGLDPGPVLLAAGVLSIAAGWRFGIPFPVQPLKALTALAVAQQLAPDVIHAAGLLIGVVLVGLSATGAADRAASVFTRPVIRSLQLAVGTLLVVAAARLALHPPAPFPATPRGLVALAMAAATLVAVAVAARRRWHGVAAVLVAGGALASAAVAAPALGPVTLTLPALAFPPVAVWPAAFVLLVVPQLPLTYGNAVVGTSDLARELFPTSAGRVTAGGVALSCGVGNVVAALVGGMPMCHGSSGLTAHARLGARTPVMNVVLGGSLVFLGLVGSQQVLALFALVPVWVLAGLLAFAGLRHALLVLDLTGTSRSLAVVAAGAGITTGNLALTTALALAIEWLPRLRRRLVTA